MTRLPIRWLAIVAVLCATTLANAADVRAWLDRNAMQLGETVTLNVEVSGTTTTAQPDFAALQGDFNLSGTQSSSSVNIVNGQSSSKVLWAVALEPKRVGTLTIPALSVGGQTTQPITLTVQATAAGGAKVGDDIYIETTVEPHAPYVQQQVSMTVKLYFAVNLIDGSLDDPQIDGVVVRKVGGQDSNFAADVGGRRYRVLERRYVLQPEKSGSLTLPPIVFRGHAMDRADMNSFFNRGRNVSARSEAITLDVRPRPGDSGKDAWLPAQSVTLAAEGIDASTAARVGEPLTLTLKLQADGLSFEQLPELTLPPIDGADIYPDKTNTQNKEVGALTVGERERKFAIVPNRPGALTIPAISIGWWDTAHDRPATASVPEITVSVQPGAAAAPSANAPVVATASAPITPAVAPSTLPPSVVPDGMWRTLACVGFGLWIVTALGWAAWAQKKKPKREGGGVKSTADGVHDLSAKVALRTACASKDWSAASRAILVMARQKNSSIRNLRELAQQIDDPSQRDAIDQLERALYAGAEVPALGDTISTAFGKSIVLHTDRSVATRGAIPPLYPTPR